MALIDEILKEFPEVGKHRLYATGELLTQAVDKDGIEISPALALASLIYGLVQADYLKLDMEKVRKILDGYFKEANRDGSRDE